MAESVVRFGVRSSDGRQSGTWRCWTNGGVDPSMYVACRALGSEFKLSFHCRTGSCNVSFTESTYNSAFEDGTLPEDRYLERWKRPPPIGPGVTLACRIIVPGGVLSDVTSVPPSIFWVPDPGVNHAVEFAVLVTTGDEGALELKRHVTGTLPVNDFALPNGEAIHVRYRAMPFVLTEESRRGATYFFKGGRAALASNEGLRAVVYCVGSLQDRVLLDVPATFKNS
jgi:hypothetical protein